MGDGARTAPSDLLAEDLRLARQDSARLFAEARLARGLTQQQAADALGVALRTLQRWEKQGGMKQMAWTALLQLPASDEAERSDWRRQPRARRAAAPHPAPAADDGAGNR